MTSPTIKELREAYNSDIKREAMACGIVGYHQGYRNALYCARNGLKVLVGKEVEPPITINDVVILMNEWLDEAEKELEKVKKEQEW